MNFDYLSKLPASLLISRMSYLPFDDVISLCQTNKRLNEICSDKYSNDWKQLIDNTYGNTEYYQQLIENNNGNQEGHIKYDYTLYTQLIHSLDPEIQIEIYRRQGDVKSYERVRLLIKINQAKNTGRILDVSFMTDDYNGIRMIQKPGPGSRKIGPKGLPIVSSKLDRYEHVIELLGPDYKHYLELYNLQSRFEESLII